MHCAASCLRSYLKLMLILTTMNSLTTMQGSFSFKNDNVYFCVLEPSIHLHITRSTDGDTAFISFVRPATDTTPVSTVVLNQIHLITYILTLLNTGDTDSDSWKYYLAK